MEQEHSNQEQSLSPEEIASTELEKKIKEYEDWIRIDLEKEGKIGTDTQQSVIEDFSRFINTTSLRVLENIRGKVENLIATISDEQTRILLREIINQEKLVIHHSILEGLGEFLSSGEANNGHNDHEKNPEEDNVSDINMENNPENTSINNPDNPDNPDSPEQSPKQLLENLNPKLDKIVEMFDRNEVTPEKWVENRSTLGHIVRAAARGGDEHMQENRQRKFLYTLKQGQDVFGEEQLADGTKSVVNYKERDLTAINQEFQDKNIDSDLRQVITREWFGRGVLLYSIYLSPDGAYALGKPGGKKFGQEGRRLVGEFIDKVNNLYARFAQYEQEHMGEIDHYLTQKRLSELEDQFNVLKLEEKLNDPTIKPEDLRGDFNDLRYSLRGLINYALRNNLLYTYFDGSGKAGKELGERFDAAHDELSNDLKARGIDYRTVSFGQGDKILLRSDIAKQLGKDVVIDDQQFVEHIFSRLKFFDDKLYKLARRIQPRPAAAPQAASTIPSSEAKPVPDVVDTTPPPAETEPPLVAPDEVIGEAKKADEEVITPLSRDESADKTTSEVGAPEQQRIKELEAENQRLAADREHAVQDKARVQSERDAARAQAQQREAELTQANARIQQLEADRSTAADPQLVEENRKLKEKNEQIEARYTRTIDELLEEQKRERLSWTFGVIDDLGLLPRKAQEIHKEQYDRFLDKTKDDQAAQKLAATFMEDLLRRMVVNLLEKVKLRRS